MKNLPITFLFAVAIFFSDCKHEKPLTCEEINFTLSVTKTDVTSAPGNGTITATATGGNGFTYSIGTTSNSTGKFESLPAGTYTVVGKNSIGCSQSQTIIIESNIPGDPCTNNSITINATSTPATPCVAGNGTINIVAGGSTGFTYNLNGGTFQNSNVFSNLSVGTYTISVKDINGCSKSQQISIANAPAGPNFTNVKNIIKSNCGSCHINGGSSAGVNYDNDCSIVNGWSKINQECVIRSSMPPSNPLSSNLKAQITAWVNAGHNYTD